MIINILKFLIKNKIILLLMIPFNLKKRKFKLSPHKKELTLLQELKNVLKRIIEKSNNSYYYVIVLNLMK